MRLFDGNDLNRQVFESGVREATREFRDVVRAAEETQSALVETTHFLIVLGAVPNGVTRKGLERLGVTPAEWESGLKQCAKSGSNGATPHGLGESSLDSTARAMLRDCERGCEAASCPRISEPILLHSALGNLTVPVAELFSSVDIDVGEWRREIEQSLEPVTPVALFGAGDGGSRDADVLLLDALSASSKKVLRLAIDEAEAFGKSQVHAGHLLMGLLGLEGGCLEAGLYQQGVAPRKVREALTMALRSGSRSAGRSELAGVRESFQPLVQRMLEKAGELAGRDRLSRVFDSHLLAALLDFESTARRVLGQSGIDDAQLRSFVEGVQISDEPDEDEASIADVKTVQRRLKERLVGQDLAIEQILPYFELFRLGFNVPGRPVGVFLFCGPSGIGKTEMAKELARSVYGSEENLIFLEMGHFGMPENMNEFVGAPPGYVGYGEGKLTNGLRDKPKSVVLFDEVEKAHPKVLDALLRFLDEGKVEDPAGPVRDGTQCIVVLTSNVVSSELAGLWRKYADLDRSRIQIRKDLRQLFHEHEFRVEFLNRVDEVLLFRPLDREDLTEIARRRLGPLLEHLKEQASIDVEVAPGICEGLGRYCEMLNEGARPVMRLMHSTVLLPAALYVAKNNCPRPVKLRVRLQDTREAENFEPIGIAEPVDAVESGHA